MSKISAISELVRKTFRFGPLIALGNVILTHGRNHLPSSILKTISDRRTKAIQRRLKPLVSKALSDYKPSQQPVIPEERIWVCWLQGESAMPPIPKICLDSIRKQANGRKVHLLTSENFRDFVKIDDNIINLYKSGRIKNCHFADILRISVLSQLGGLWMDATLFCSSEISSKFFSTPFHTIRTAPFGNFVSQCRWAVFCLGAHPGNKLFSLLERLFADYLSHESLFVDYFLFDQFIDILYKLDSEVKDMIDSVPLSNAHIFELSRILTDSYDPKKWDSITSDTSVFKLNWKAYPVERLESAPSDSFFHFVKSISQ